MADESKSIFVTLTLMGNVAEVLLGFSTEQSKVNLLPHVLSGNMDAELLVLFRELPNTAVGSSPEEKLALLKQRIRKFIEQIFADAAEADRQEEAAQKERKRQEVLRSLQERNKPSTEGTVAELAARFNVSKSEIRRRKQDGTLSELLLADEKLAKARMQNQEMFHEMNSDEHSK